MRGDANCCAGAPMRTTSHFLDDLNTAQRQVYVFRAKRADRIKLLWWDGTGICLLTKRLEGAPFRWPPIQDSAINLTAVQMAALLEGVDWTGVHALEVERAHSGDPLSYAATMQLDALRLSEPRWIGYSAIAALWAVVLPSALCVRASLSKSRRHSGEMTTRVQPDDDAPAPRLTASAGRACRQTRTGRSASPSRGHPQAPR